MAYAGREAASSCREDPLIASASSTTATAAAASRPGQTPVRITPPFPSPPIAAPSSNIFSTTCTSPTAVSVTGQPFRPAASLTICEVDRVVTTGPGRRDVTAATASAKV